MPSEKRTTWDRVVGQNRVKRLLRTAVERERIAQAYLFYGPEGAGMDAMAIEFARTLNCQTQKPEPCGSCQSCRQFDTLQHPNLSLIFALPRGKSETPDEPPTHYLSEEQIRRIQKELQAKAKNPYHRLQIEDANEIRIGSIRQLRRSAPLSSFGEGWKVFILFDADDMNEEAMNALLKTLEEPPPRTVLILTTTRREKLRPTILSRCQPIKFDSLDRETIRTALIDRHGLESDKAELIATIANGSFSRALNLLEQDLTRERTSVVDFIENLLKKNPLDLMTQIEELADKYDRSELGDWLSLMLVWFRDANQLREGRAEGIVNVDQMEKLTSFARHFPHADYSRAVQHIERAIALVGRNVYLPAVLGNLAYELRGSIAVGPKEPIIESKST